MNCENCAFWVAAPEVGGGACRRYAPRPTTTGQRTYWPPTKTTEWCGEWEEKRN